jgi:hypothetical protein
MNPGFLSFVLLVIAFILLSSGWKDLLLRSISHKGILLFFVAWIGLSRITVSWQHIKLNMTFALVLAVTAVVLAKTEGMAAKLHLLSVGLLLGSFHFLLQEVLERDPILIVARSDIDIAVSLGLITVALQRSVGLQLACLSLGLAMGDFYYALLHKQSAAAAGYMGSPSFRDKWWMAIFVSRGATLLVQGLLYGGKQALQLWADRRKEWRK